MVLGSNDLVSVVALAGKVDVGHVVVYVNATGHLGLKSSLSSSFHYMAINI